MTDQEREQYLAVRKEAALKIDPETAEVTWWYMQTLDPYGIEDLPPERQQVQRGYFARAPGSDVWVSFWDLTVATEKALWDKHASRLAFPAGLPVLRTPDTWVIELENGERQEFATREAWLDAIYSRDAKR